MMNAARRLCLTIGCAVWLVAPASLSAQGLEQAFERAWSLDPLAASLDARAAEAAARAEVASGATPGPAAASFGVLSDRMNRNDGAQKWEVELGVPLWLPGQQAARQSYARSTIDEVEAQRAALRLSIAGETRSRWWALAAARSARELALRRAATAATLEADVLRRVAAGELARTDANLAGNERLAADSDVIDAQVAVLGAEANFRALTGIDAPAVLAAESPVPSPTMPDRHPRLLAATAAAEVARAALLVAARSNREAPTVAVRLERDRATAAEPLSSAIGLRVTIPFSSGPRLREQTAAAIASASRADAELALTRARIAIDVERARTALEAADRQLDTARRRQALTVDNLRLTEKAFALGEADLTTLLRVRAAALEAESLGLRQRVTRDEARSQLHQSLGLLP